MRKVIYNAIQEALATIPDVKTVGLWNNQVSYAEEEQPFEVPAVFIEFGTIDWRDFLCGTREAVIDVKLHVVTDSRVSPWSDTLATFDLIDTIHAKLHALHSVEEDGSVMDSLTAIQSITDHDFDELQDNVEVYECHVRKKPKITTQKVSGFTPVVEIEITT